MTTTKRISARLPADVVDRIDSAAKAERRTFTGQLTHVLDAALTKGKPMPKNDGLSAGQRQIETALTDMGPRDALKIARRRGATMDNCAPSTRRTAQPTVAAEAPTLRGAK